MCHFEWKMQAFSVAKHEFVSPYIMLDIIGFLVAMLFASIKK
jgi:hypothetical protein